LEGRRKKTRGIRKGDKRHKERRQEAWRKKNQATGYCAQFKEII